MSRIVLTLLLCFSLQVLSSARSICSPCLESWFYNPWGRQDLCCYDKSDDHVDFLLTIPTKLTTGSNQTACVSLLKVDQRTIAFLTVKLLDHDGVTVYDSFKATMYHRIKRVCFILKIPTVTFSPESLVKLASVSASLRVFTRRSPNPLVLTASQKVAIMRKSILVFINTDKTIYQPGQTVNFRVLQLEEIYPANETVEKITIYDPQNRKIWEVRERIPTVGLVSDKFGLVAEPTKGTWSIHVDIARETYKTTFKVEEYVLPKFEVSVDAPKYITMKTKSFVVRVCGKYTYGKAAQGEIEVTIHLPWFLTILGNSTSKVDIRSDAYGCANVVHSPDMFEFSEYSKHYNSGSLGVSAKFTDDITDTTISAPYSSITLTLNPYLLEFANWKQIWNPSRIMFEVRYKDLDGKPLPGRIVSVVIDLIHFSGKTITSSFNRVLNEHGTAAISLDLGTAKTYHVKAHDALLPQTETYFESDSKIFCRAISKEGNVLSDNSYIKLDQPEFEACNQHQIFSGDVMLVKPLSESFLVSTVPGVFQMQEIYYHVIVREEIRESGKVQTVLCAEIENPVAKTLHCRFALDLAVVEWIPEGKLLVYFFEAPEIFSDHIKVSSNCFLNEVTIEMSSHSVIPGHDINITLNAQRESLCALSVVDKSVHLLGGDNGMKKESVKSAWKKSDIGNPTLFNNGYSGCDRMLDDYSTTEEGYISESLNRMKRRKRSLSADDDFLLNSRQRRQSAPLDEGFHGSLPLHFQKSGLLLITNLHIRYNRCPRYSMECTSDYTLDGNICADIDECAGPNCLVAFGMYLSPSRRLSENVIEVRNYFPETWKWELVQIRNNGKTEILEKMPDTITEWVASAYCVSPETGIGIAEVVRVKGFKSMFLSVNMPYSVIRSEEVTLKTTLFSYYEESECLEMVISVDPSDDFELLNEGTIAECLCGKDSFSVEYQIRPLAIGEVKFIVKAWSIYGHACGKVTQAKEEAKDGVERILLVEPEGVEVQVTHNDFICLDDESTESFVRNFSLPDDHYQGSSLLLLSVTGNVMGSVLDNLENLVQQPYGCGEQNMITMVPNIVVHKYLEAIGMLTPKLKQKIESNIKYGYQRQLNYQRKDGSFSAFGNRDSSGSTWLTAFVISTFQKAKEYIFIDDEVIEQATRFIKGHIEDNGCWMKVGLVHDRAMMGGLDGLNAFSAYVSLALFESSLYEREESDADVHGCDGSRNIKIYTKAIKFYSNALTRKYSAARTLWSSLKSLARLQDGTSFETTSECFWSDEEPSERQDYMDSSYYYKTSDAVEVTAYVLLGYLEMQKAFPEEFPLSLTYSIVKWINTQRNSLGGYSNTQNTVVGLSALAAYATQAYVANSEMAVSIGHNTENVTTFNVFNDNSLVTQQAVIKTLPSSLNYSAQGRGCVLIQSNLKYNVPVKQNDSSFTVSAHVRSKEGGCDSDDFRYLVVCASYQGTDEYPFSNMVVFEISMVSGYEAVYESLEKMVVSNVENGLKRYEKNLKKVNVYFDEIGPEMKCAAFEIVQTVVVKNPQPGIVHVYDYYNPVREESISYNMSCMWENYDGNPSIDCLTWGSNGVCEVICSQRMEHHGVFSCIDDVTRDAVVNHCKIVGQGICGANGRCININDGYRCSCHKGYKYNALLNTCVTENGQAIIEDAPLYTSPDCGDVCPQPALILKNADGETYDCDSGFNLVENGRQSYCEDVNECLTNICDDMSEACVNQPGSYSCVCKEGYEYFTEGDEEHTPRCIKSGRNVALTTVTSPATNYTTAGGILESNVTDGPGSQNGTEIIPQSCASCYSEFPKSDKLRQLLCPKQNVYIVSELRIGSLNLIPIVLHGKAVDEKVIKGVRLLQMDDCPLCRILLMQKSILVTSQTVTKDSRAIDENIITFNETVTFIPKRAWKKVQKFNCD